MTHTTKYAPAHTETGFVNARQRVLDEANIPEEHRAIVGLEVNRHTNICGGRPSDAARTVVRDYKTDPERFVARAIAERQQERETGFDAFGSQLQPTEIEINRALRHIDGLS